MAHRPIIARQQFAAPAQRIFDLFTQSSELSKWFCDAADSDAQAGGQIHAAWVDEDGQPWDRIGVWSDWDPPYRATLTWDADEAPTDAASVLAITGSTPLVLHVDSQGTLAAPPPAAQADYVKIAIADHPQGCVLTVLCPLMQLDDVVRPDVMHDALQIGWTQTLQSLAELVAQDGLPNDIAK